MSLEEYSSEPARVIALVMAAGKSRRFGSDKRHFPISDHTTLLQATLTLAQTNFEETWVVIGATDHPEELNIPSSVHLVRAPVRNVGLGTSLGAAFSALLSQRPYLSAAAVVLADMPWVLGQTCLRLIEASNPERIVRPRFESKAGHPVVFGRAFWPQLAKLRGEEGARQVLESNSQACEFIDIKDPNIHKDIDIPSDFTHSSI